MAAFGAAYATAQAHRYIVSAEPLHLGVPSSAICIAIEPDSPRGVWWWEPGTAGCRNRSTGPGVFDAEVGTVNRPSPSGVIEFSFRMPLHARPLVDPPFIDLALVIDERGMGPRTSDVRVPVEQRTDLDIPSVSGAR